MQLFNFTDEISTSISHDTRDAFQLNIFPNPVGNILTLDFRNEKISTRIYDLSGRQILYKKEVLENKGGFIYAHWDGTPETEEQVKDETKATIRCIPIHREMTPGTCMVTGKPSKGKVLFAKAY